MGKIPKAFKIIPNLKNWEDVLYMTDPDHWSEHAMFQVLSYKISDHCTLGTPTTGVSMQCTFTKSQISVYVGPDEHWSKHAMYFHKISDHCT